MQQREKVVVLNAKDNVATALADLEAGTNLELHVNDKNLEVKLTAAVPFCHKFSLCKIKQGAPIIKYGEVIGIATCNIYIGDYVHIHNVVSTRGRGDHAGGVK